MRSKVPSDPPPPVPAEGTDDGLVCRKLRTKLAFSTLVTEDGEVLGWRRGDGSTAVYWCLCTMECAGPDGALVHGGECGPKRACYQAPD